MRRMIRERRGSARYGASVTSIDFEKARRFIAAVPRGRWTSYKDVAIAAGSPGGAQAIGQWLRRDGDKVPHVWRVLTVDGQVADGFMPAGPGVPAKARVADVLRREGLSIDGRGRAAPSRRFRAEDFRVQEA